MLKIVYSIDALQALIEEEKQEALTQLGEHYQNQLQSLQDHISDLQKRLSDATATVIDFRFHIFLFLTVIFVFSRRKDKLSSDTYTTLLLSKRKE